MTTEGQKTGFMMFCLGLAFGFSAALYVFWEELHTPCKSEAVEQRTGGDH